MKAKLIPILLLAFQLCWGQDFALDEKISRLGVKVLQSRNLEDRLNADKELRALLNIYLKHENGFQLDLGVQRTISDLYAPNNAFRLISWAIPLEEEKMRYSAFLVLPGDSLPLVYELSDSSEAYYFELEEIHGPEKWFGALYYEIVHERHKKKDFYILLGWDSYSQSSTRKIIEPLTFDDKKEPIFGAKVLKTEKKPQARVILEYSKDAGVSLQYNKDLKMIVYDHLVPMDGAPIGMYSFYIPDFTYDGFKFKKGKWIHQSMVKPENLNN